MGGFDVPWSMVGRRREEKTPSLSHFHLKNADIAQRGKKQKKREEKRDGQ